MSGRVRGRALADTTWCIVKHLLCAEEHSIEAVQRLERILKETEDEKLKKKVLSAILELCRIGDSIRGLRQRLVDYTLEFERWAKSGGVD